MTDWPLPLAIAKVGLEWAKTFTVSVVAGGVKVGVVPLDPLTDK